MAKTSEIDRIKSNLINLRGNSVILDSDLVTIYGVTTSAINQAVSRNLNRFPEDFAFTISKDEFADLKSQNVISSGHGGRRKPPRVFTEHGALMASTVLRTDKAAKMSVFVVRAFVKMREEISANQAILKRIAQIDKSLLLHDQSLRDIYQKLMPLLAPKADPPKRRIGFKPDNK